MYIQRVGDFEKIYQFESFPAEFKKLASGGKWNAYRNWLFRNLENLEKHPHQVVDGFRIEKLQGTAPPLYAIRKPNGRAGNPRVVFAYISSDGDICLLYAFEEKNASDYDRAITIAHNRLQRIEEGE